MKEKGNWVTKEKREIPHNLYRITQYYSIGIEIRVLTRQNQRNIFY